MKKAIIPILMIAIISVLAAPLACFATELEIEKDAMEKLAGIDEAEKSVVNDIFELNSQISALDSRIDEISCEIENLLIEIEAKEEKIESLNIKYGKLKNSLAEVLKMRQRAGAMPLFMLFFKAESIKDFLRQTNLLRDLLKSSRDISNDIEATLFELDRENAGLQKMKSGLDGQKQEAEAAIADRKSRIHELEAYMDELEQDKEVYEEYLQSIRDTWAGLKAAFTETVCEFREIIESGDMPADTVGISGSIFNPKGTIYEGKFNSLLNERDDLPELEFVFRKDSVKLGFPEYEMEIDGYFELLDENTILYIPVAGVFYGLDMSEEALADLLGENDLAFSLESILDGNSIKRIEQHDGYIELYIDIGLF